MLFVEAQFFFFFGLVFLVHWALRSHRHRKLWLLACSYWFYASWDWRFLSLIVFSTVVDYCVGRALENETRQRRRRLWLLVSLVGNLGVLGFFKYYNFFVEAASDLLTSLGLQPVDWTLEIILPVGISFYTFQTLSYAIDVYHGRIKPIRDIFDFATFVAFFPQLVAGPIVRASEFLPQLEKPRVFARDVRVRWALTLFLIGFFKKAVVADSLALVTDPACMDPQLYSSLAIVGVMLLAAVQIYCDFSGYSDMALATAGLLGYRLPLNFHFPLLARNIADFWRRWHISLTTWIRDYLYVALLGHRAPSQTSGRQMFMAMVVTMGLMGLWHGASWNFLVFGLVHGFFLLVHRWWERRRRRDSVVGRAVSMISLPLTCYCLLFSFTLFRVTKFEKAGILMRHLAFLQPDGGKGLELRWIALFGVLALVHMAFRRKLFARQLEQVPDWAYAIGYGCAWSVILTCVASGYQPFIYFQF